jgi:polar amino acid transport system substrate-binding protein
MTVRKFVISLVAALVFAGTASAADKIRIGTEGAYPPFNQIDANGNVIGFDVDIAKALCEKMQADCVIVTQDWDGIIPGLLAKKYDAIVASMSITDERKKAVAFTDPYYSNSLRFIAKKGLDIDPNNLKGKTIGAQRATISGSYLEDNLKDVVDIKLYDTQENAYLDLGADRVDAVLGDMLVNYEWLNSDEGRDFEFKGEAIDIDDKIGIALRKDDTELVKRFNKALAAIRADGTYDKINAKYFPFSIY